MALDLANYEKKARESVKAFWGNREAARQKQIELGNIDQGERSAVTAGKNLNGFVALIEDLVEANGLTHATVHLKKRVLTIPGFFRPTKDWDLLITNDGRLVAALELKSQVGPSFGNNFNNRTEEAIGTATDFATALREGAFGESTPPFIGWVMMVEDCDKSRSPVRARSPHFAVLPEFEGASYLDRYNLLCKKLVLEGLYTAAALIASPRSAIKDGAHTSLSEVTSLKTFVTTFAGHVASEAARQ